MSGGGAGSCNRLQRIRHARCVRGLIANLRGVWGAAVERRVRELRGRCSPFVPAYQHAMGKNVRESRCTDGRGRLSECRFWRRRGGVVKQTLAGVRRALTLAFVFASWRTEMLGVLRRQGPLLLTELLATRYNTAWGTGARRRSTRSVEPMKVSTYSGPES